MDKKLPILAIGGLGCAYYLYKKQEKEIIAGPKYYLGIETGGTTCKIGIISNLETFEIIAKKVIPTSSNP